MKLSNQALIIIAVVVILLIAAIPVFLDSLENISQTTDSAETLLNEDDTTISSDIEIKMKRNEPVSEENILDVADLVSKNFTYEGAILDVTDGEIIRDLDTESAAIGVARTVYEDAEFFLYSETIKLPDPIGSDFFEGWLVRAEPFAYISTGILEKNADGKWINEFGTITDYSDFTRYIVTLEPNDSDPAPAFHILEGELSELNLN